MKSIPFRKGQLDLYYCQSCTTYRAPNIEEEHNHSGWEFRDVVYGEGEVIHESEYYHDDSGNYRRYYREYSAATLVWCTNCQCVISNDYDGDEFDRRMSRTQQAWQCSNCQEIWPSKEDADVCCA